MTSSIKRRSQGLCFSLFLIAGCGSSSPTSPTTDFISLTSIVPAAGTALNAGDRVTFTAVVTCTIVNSNGGFTAMVIQDQANRTLRVEEEMQSEAPLAKGTTTVTLSQTIKVPVSGSTVTVALPIFVNESTTTRAVVTRQYAVR
jgi:hypothetical protein